jgi:flagellar hook-associated protein 2
MSTTTSSTTSVPTGTTGAGGGNMLRITGLNTGLDVDAMVKKMLTSDQTKIDQAKQAQQLIQWRQEAYQSIIKDVKDLQSAYFDITNSSNCLLSSGNYDNMTAASSDATVVNATASTKSVAGSYKILVSQLATSTNIQGTDKVVASDGTTAATTSTTLTGTGSSGLGLTPGSYSLKLSYGNGKSTTVNLNITSTSTINDLTTAIKTQTNGAVTAKLDDLTGKFSIQTSDTGSSSNLKIENVSTTDTTAATLLAKFNINVDGTNGVSGTGQQDALFAIKEPGSSNYIVGENSSNNFVVNGVSYSLADVNDTSNANISQANVGKSITTTSSDIPVSISVSQDTSKVKDLISNFLDKYNNLVGELQDKLSEKKNYDYKPLTDTQKSSMSTTDITNWETKAKQGILRNDDNLQNLLYNLTNAFYSPVLDSSGNKVSTLYFGNYGANSIGIDTSNETDQGSKITITDDTKFTDAITNHADEIMKLFTTTSDSDDKTTKFNQSGIFQRIDQIIDDNVGMIGSSYNHAILTKYANIQDDKSIFGGSGDGTLPDQIYQKQLLINNLTSTMSDDQTKYYNQFTQLETTMEELNSQQSVISSYFS